MICKSKRHLRDEMNIYIAWFQKTADPKWLEKAIKVDAEIHTRLLTESRN